MIPRTNRDKLETHNSALTGRTVDDLIRNVYMRLEIANANMHYSNVQQFFYSVESLFFIVYPILPSSKNKEKPGKAEEAVAGFDKAYAIINAITTKPAFRNVSNIELLLLTTKYIFATILQGLQMRQFFFRLNVQHTDGLSEVYYNKDYEEEEDMPSFADDEDNDVEEDLDGREVEQDKESS